jgi:hypothetical protein
MQQFRPPRRQAIQRLSRLWRDDGWPTLRLAAPVMVARAGVVFLFFVDSLMTGRGGAQGAFLGRGSQRNP